MSRLMCPKCKGNKFDIFLNSYETLPKNHMELVCEKCNYTLITKVSDIKENQKNKIEVNNIFCPKCLSKKIRMTKVKFFRDDIIKIECLKCGKDSLFDFNETVNFNFNTSDLYKFMEVELEE